MSRKHPGEIAAGLAAFSHRDRVRIAKEAGRLRAEAMTELIRAAGRGQDRYREELRGAAAPLAELRGLARRVRDLAVRRPRRGAQQRGGAEGRP